MELWNLGTLEPWNLEVLKRLRFAVVQPRLVHATGCDPAIRVTARYMSDRKYKQRGYQDDDRDRRPPRQDGQADGPAQAGPNARLVRRLARGASRRKARRTPTCPASARWRAARAAARWSTRRYFRAASAPSADRICARARSACISIRARDWNARSRLRRECRPRMPPTNARSSRHARRWERETSSAVSQQAV